ncbi:TolC family protein [Aestuariibaculum suncheonense]|uniref:TolC family protein n=1 Tax=Aestuariibaculum suncheonense TaxID=1028745 RepID=A0A8J6QT90_9FLAO|nr:TolC family protein [Aestuariibaculum suncheonense]MBD0835389.1 TolC family protein [Aestuariibaculum suncheonense]
MILKDNYIIKLKILPLLSLLFCVNTNIQAQTIDDKVFTLEEYLGYVKQFHPIVKQAQLLSSEGEIKLLKARGAFDPKIEVDYNKKEFTGTEYYDKLNAAFKIPTWYGIELKANYENNEGYYLNPESKVPDDGLYSAGVSMSLAKGFLANERMATLKQAKLYRDISLNKQSLAVNEVLYNAVETYFNWLKYYQEYKVYADYQTNADERLKNVITSFEAGDKPAVDTLEASINYKNRALDVEKSRIKYIKSQLELSNFLWLENNTPVELDYSLIPDVNSPFLADKVLNSSLLEVSDDVLENHPKIQSLALKRQQLVFEKRLNTNNLLPKIDLQYNFLTSDYENLNSLNTQNYKAGLNISMPLFLRKERADLKLTKLKLQDVDFNLSSTKVSLLNKINAVQQEIESYEKQSTIIQNLVNDYKQLVVAEEKKFELGEGSLFLINYREAKLIETELKNIEVTNKVLLTKAMFAQILNTLEY